MKSVMKNKIVAYQTNVHTKVSSLCIVCSITSELANLCEGDFLFPKQVLDKDFPIPLGLPTIVAEKKVKTADPNPQNFFSFNKLYGHNTFVNESNRTSLVNNNREHIKIYYKNLIINRLEQF
jgi:hypothetical protein